MLGMNPEILLGKEYKTVQVPSTCCCTQVVRQLLCNSLLDNRSGQFQNPLRRKQRGRRAKRSA